MSTHVKDPILAASIVDCIGWIATHAPKEFCPVRGC